MAPISGHFSPTRFSINSYILLYITFLNTFTILYQTLHVKAHEIDYHFIPINKNKSLKKT